MATNLEVICMSSAIKNSFLNLDAEDLRGEEGNFFQGAD